MTVANPEGALVNGPALKSNIKLRGNTRLRDMLSAAVLATPPTLAARTTGLTAATEPAAAQTALNALTGAAPTIQAVKPAYDTPWSDPRLLIVGPYGRLNNGGAGMDAGACQATTPAGAGPTGVLGWHCFSFDGRYLLLRQRDTTATQYATIWLSKNGGPFQPHVDVNNGAAPQAFASPGDSLYMLQPVDLGAVAQWDIIIEGEALTFGGVWTQATDTVALPSFDAPVAVGIGDSYIATSGQNRVITSYFRRAALQLGMLPHTSAYGGTGFSAVGGDATSHYKYGDPARLAAEVTPYLNARPPAWIHLQGSINDGLYNFAGTAQLDSDIAALMSTASSYGALVTTNKPMHPYRGDLAANANDTTVGTQIATHAATYGIPVFDPVGDGILTGTGYAGNPTGDGTSDRLSFTDHEHPSIEGSTVLGRLLARFVATQAVSVMDAAVTASQLSTLGYSAGQAAPGSGRGAANGFAALDGNSVLLNPQTVLPAGLWSDYKFLTEKRGRLSGAPAAGNYILTDDPVNNPPALAAAGSDMGIIDLAPADFAQAIGALGQKWRMRFHVWIPSDIAPGCNITLGFYAAGALAAGGMSGLGAQYGNPFAVDTPAAHSKNSGSSGLFVAPAAETFFCVVATLSAPPAAGSIIAIRAILERNSQ